MTVIVAYRDKAGKAVLVADRVWFGYGNERVTGRKIHALSDCIVAMAGESRTVALAQARNFGELVKALEEQAESDALIVHLDRIFVYLTVGDKVSKVREHGYEFHRTIGCYHAEVNHAIMTGDTPEEAVGRIHSLWKLDLPVDVADMSWCNMWECDTMPQFKKIETEGEPK